MQQQNPQKVEASKVPEYIKKAAKKAAEFNSNFNRERMEERRAYFDLQTHVSPTWKNSYLLNDNPKHPVSSGALSNPDSTQISISFCVFAHIVCLLCLFQIIQVPQGRFKVLAPELTRTGPYPVALIPGQFQDYYKRSVTPVYHLHWPGLRRMYPP